MDNISISQEKHSTTGVERFLKKSKSMTCSESKKFAQDDYFINIPQSVLNFELMKVSRSASMLWQKLFDLTKFSDDWSICISNQQLGEMVGRAAHTIYVQLKELVNIGLIEKEARSGKSNLIKVRFPEFVKKISRTRNETKTPFKTEGGKKPYSLYIYNNINNNNNSSNYKVNERKKLESDIVVDLNLIKTETEKIMPSPEIEKAEKMLSLISSEIVETCKEKPFNLEKYNKLGEKESTLKVFIAKLKAQDKIKQQQLEKAAKPKVNFLTKPGDRQINEFDRMRLLRLSPTRAQEVAFCVRYGSLKRSKYGGEDNSVSHAINIAFKLLRENRWEKPGGMPC